MKRSKYLIAAMLFTTVALTTACDKKGSGNGFKGYINERESFPTETSEVVETEAVEVPNTSGTDVEYSSRVDESSIEESFTEASSEDATEEKTESATEAPTPEAYDMTNVTITGVDNGDNDYFTITNPRVSSYEANKRYSITFDIQSNDGNKYTYAVKDPTINNKPVESTDSSESTTMTVDFLFKDNVSYGSFCASFGCDIVVLSLDTGEEVYTASDVTFSAELTQRLN